jgi:hypothetical protein
VLLRKAGIEMFASSSSVAFLSAALLVCVAVDPAYSQQQYRNTREEGSFRVHLETSVFWSLWDDSRNELFTSSGTQYPASRTATLVNIYNVVSGKKRSVDILKEFPNARNISVEGLAVGPEGSVLVACEVNSDNGAFAGGNLLLYDNHSTLITGLTATGYDVGAVAVDEESNIYVLGTHDGESSSDESYPLMVEYDSRGSPLLNMLPRSLFSDVDDPVGSGLGYRSRGASRLAVGEKAVEVYLAPAGEMVVLNQAGEIQKRVNVVSRLSEFAQANGYKAFHIDEDEFSPARDLWLVGNLEDPSGDASVALPARNFVVRLTPTGQLEVPYEHVGEEPPGQYLPRLIGFTQSGQPVGASTPAEPAYLVVQENPY